MKGKRMFLVIQAVAGFVGHYGADLWFMEWGNSRALSGVWDAATGSAIKCHICELATVGTAYQFGWNLFTPLT